MNRKGLFCRRSGLKVEFLGQLSTISSAMRHEKVITGEPRVVLKPFWRLSALLYPGDDLL
jgi:hypothetical protein